MNADLIAAERWPGDPESHAYDAGGVAEATRSALIERGLEFITETVFSHPSKVELVDQAQAAGYFVALHVLMVPVEVAVSRVAYRVDRGGHAVPVDKIRGRYRRLWPNVARAVDRVNSAAFWDNEVLHGPILVAQIANGILLEKPRWPEWTPTALTDRWCG